MSALALVTEKCLHSLRAFPLSPSRLAGGDRGLGGYTVGTVDLRWSQKYSTAHHAMLSVTSSRPGRGKRIVGISLPKQPQCWSPASLEWLHTCLLVGSRERMPYFAVLHLLNSFSSKFMSFFLSTTPIPSLTLLGRRSSSVGWSCFWG